MKILKFISCLFLLALIYSCKDEYTICDLPTIVRMKCYFYSNVGGVENKTHAPLLTVIRLPTNFPDYNVQAASNFSLALNPLTDSVLYHISISDASTADTVSFVYTTSKVNLSPICGDIYLHNLTKVTTTVNTLDSVKISSGVINTASGENVRIYF